ncbi:flagellar biosynthetic protein FliR [Corallococcus exiguus]|uniref:EscT/YscT/HrcT family type III secretion system export apparatus protein n=1 Tax=Corallococcus TaxID=83461 RepID=UPI000EEC3A6A|nr:flagellar biosynthetic protein FliR [Corallococcus sp. AB032C]NNB89537.1 flagellar biosynthetic protein FliR [Corallococcus exiguus]NNB98374.1 flagellar biosynthetic protein FliR [Corallococcus exiguus]NPC50988.1 flagellar biosynthetic protein FliR [Corallococcus exiguus]RKH81971.1 type III secretion protein [Corallococcus sp. AB032C]
MNPAALGEQLLALGPHVVAVALCAARLVPIAFLCPLLGGQAAPTTVRLGLVLALSLFLHVEAGVEFSGTVETPVVMAALVVRELAYGVSVGLVAALPFDAARMSGRFIDLFRGTSAEASLPQAGSRESATGDALYHLLVARVVSGALFPVVLSALLRGFGVVQLGAFVPTEASALHVVVMVGGAMATGLAVGAPVAAASLAVDCFLGMASRAAAQVNLQELGAPLRILGGGALLWLGVGLLCERLLAGVASTEGALALLGEVSR